MLLFSSLASRLRRNCFSNFHYRVLKCINHCVVSLCLINLQTALKLFKIIRDYLLAALASNPVFSKEDVIESEMKGLFQKTDADI